MCLGLLAEGVVLISNILHRARSIAPIRTAVVRIDPRPSEGASGLRRPGAKNPSEGGQDCRLGGRKLGRVLINVQMSGLGGYAEML